MAGTKRAAHTNTPPLCPAGWTCLSAGEDEPMRTGFLGGSTHTREARPSEESRARGRPWPERSAPLTQTHYRSIQLVAGERVNGGSNFDSPSYSS